MSLRNFKTIDYTINVEETQSGYVALLEKVLSDNSKCYQVRGYDIDQDEYIIDCIDKKKSRRII